PDHFATGDVREIRPERCACLRALDGVTHYALRRHKNIAAASLRISARFRRRFLLRGEPSVKLLLRFCQKHQPHESVLFATVFSTLSTKFAGAIRSEPRRGRMSRHEIFLAVNVRDPKAVD